MIFMINGVEGMGDRGLRAAIRLAQRARFQFAQRQVEHRSGPQCGTEPLHHQLHAFAALSANAINNLVKGMIDA